MCARWLVKIIPTIFVSTLILANVCDARDVTVFAINKNLQMSPKDAIYKDYYINGGADDGLRRGMVVTVIRRTPVHDMSRNKALGDIHLPVAKIKLIYVQKTLSIGRLHALVQGNNIPSPDYASVMVGDRVSFTDGSDGPGADTGIESIKSTDEGEEGNKPDSTEAPAGDAAKAASVQAEVKATEAKSSDVKPAEAQKTPEPKVDKPTEKPTEKPAEARKPSTEEKTKTSQNSEKGKKPLKSEAKPDTNPPAVTGPAA